ncbi:MAG: hypothetical protein NTX28_15245 [Novosphingobium sp.]|nr:hypothetical protein [Novosphingobium sp.]
MRIRALLAAGAIGALALSSAAWAQAVVVRSTGPSAVSYPKGKRLAANASVTLKAGDVVTVLDKAGTRVLKGAGAFVIDSAVNRDRGAAALLARSLSNPASVRAGAVRGGPSGDADVVLPVSIWIADTAQGGNVCVPRGSDLYLWRARAEARSFTWLTESEGGEMVRMQWPLRTAGIAWPKTILTPQEGRTYRIFDETTPDKATEFRIVTLEPEAVPADAAALGTLLLDNGCKAQFEWLADVLAAPAASDSPADPPPAD